MPQAEDALPRRQRGVADQRTHQPWAEAQRQKNRSESRPSRNVGLSSTEAASTLAKHSGSNTQRNPACRTANAASTPTSASDAQRKAADFLQCRFAVERGQKIRSAKLGLALLQFREIVAAPESADISFGGSPDRRTRPFGNRLDRATR